MTILPDVNAVHGCLDWYNTAWEPIMAVARVHMTSKLVVLNLNDTLQTQQQQQQQLATCTSHSNGT